MMGTGLDEKAREELMSKMIKQREKEQKKKDDPCEGSFTLNKKLMIK